MMTGLRLGRDRRASTAVEFAIVGVGLVSFMFAIINLGMILWAQGALQTVAGMAARCGAIGTSCATSSAVQAYAVNHATSWIFSPVITNTNVTAASASSSCPLGGSGNTAPGSFYYVAITSTYFTGSWLPYPFNNYTVNVSACFPM